MHRLRRTVRRMAGCGEIEVPAGVSLVQPSYPAGRVSGGEPGSGVPGVVGRVVGGAGVIGAAYYQPMVLGCVGALALLLVVGVVFPAVWSRDATRRRAAVTVLRLLLTALVGDRVATAVTAATPTGRGRKRDGSTQAGVPSN